MLIARALFSIAGHLPVRCIDIDGRPYLERYYVGSFGGITAYLHRFISSDDERNVHDHPWDWSAALILTGGYLEERVRALCTSYGWLSDFRRIFPFRVNVIRGGDFHRITAPRPETWTLFMHGQKTKGWGFLSRVLGSGPEQSCVIYHQPLTSGVDVGPSTAWHLSAPRGRDSQRLPWTR